MLAADHAAQRAAATDAEQLLGRALDAADRAGDLELAARARLARAAAEEALTAYDDAWSDLEAAFALARETGDRRLEMRVRRALGGDVAVARGRHVEECIPHLRAGLRLAETLGDRTASSDLLARLTVVETNRLSFVTALEHGRRAVAEGRSAGRKQAFAVALDGLKTPLAYLGDVDELTLVLDELEPMLRRSRDMWRLQWAVFESASPAMSRGDWSTARTRLTAALDLNRRSGYPAYGAFFRAHGAWVDRLAGPSATRGGRGPPRSRMRNGPVTPGGSPRPAGSTPSGCWPQATRGTRGRREPRAQSLGGGRGRGPPAALPRAAGRGDR